MTDEQKERLARLLVSKINNFTIEEGRYIVRYIIEDGWSKPSAGMVANEQNRNLLYKIIRNSTLWDACALEAYERDVQDLIENILFVGDKFSLPS